MKGFVVIEGLDGSGKSTQIKLLREFLESTGIKYEYLHFPRNDVGYYGHLISRFLRGDFGSLESVSPWLASLLYAGDRNDAKGTVGDWLKKGRLVIVDRYLYSNIAFQCAKFDNAAEKLELERWILDFEYSGNRIPKPDLSIFLDVPFLFVEKELQRERTGDDRAYLGGKSDIHENSVSLQRRVAAEYRRLVETYDDFISIDCTDADGMMLPPETVHRELVSTLGLKGLL